MYYILGMVVFWVGVVLSLTMKGILFSSLLVPSAIALQFFAILGVLTATQSFKVFWGGLKAAIFPKRPLDEEVRGRAASLYRLLSKTAALVSVVGLIIGLVAMFHYWDDVYGMGHALAAALITPLWGIMLIVSVFEPLVFVLKKRQKE